jgi:hypothetical protein
MNAEMTFGSPVDGRDLIHGALFEVDHPKGGRVPQYSVLLRVRTSLNPFTGRAPSGCSQSDSIIGRANTLRGVQLGCRRHQVWGRITRQPAGFLEAAPKPMGVGWQGQAGGCALRCAGSRKPMPSGSPAPGVGRCTTIRGPGGSSLITSADQARSSPSRCPGYDPPIAHVTFVTWPKRRARLL